MRYVGLTWLTGSPICNVWTWSPWMNGCTLVSRFLSFEKLGWWNFEILKYDFLFLRTFLNLSHLIISAIELIWSFFLKLFFYCAEISATRKEWPIIGKNLVNFSNIPKSVKDKRYFASMWFFVLTPTILSSEYIFYRFWTIIPFIFRIWTCIRFAETDSI